MGGFNLPPGVTASMLPGNEPTGPCEVCGGDPEASDGAPNGCICPECPECETFGDPECYEKHGLVRTADQIAGRERVDAQIKAEAERDAAYYAEMASEEGYYEQ